MSADVLVATREQLVAARFVLFAQARVLESQREAMKRTIVSIDEVLVSLGASVPGEAVGVELVASPEPRPGEAASAHDAVGSCVNVPAVSAGEGAALSDSVEQVPVPGGSPVPARVRRPPPAKPKYDWELVARQIAAAEQAGVTPWRALRDIYGVSDAMGRWLSTQSRRRRRVAIEIVDVIVQDPASEVAAVPVGDDSAPPGCPAVVDTGVLPDRSKGLFTPDVLAWIAARYLELHPAADVGDVMHSLALAALAEQLEVNQSTVSMLLRRCRQDGMLGGAR